MSERVNIKSMMVESEKRPYLFNPFTDTTPLQREGMKAAREGLEGKELSSHLAMEAVLGSVIDISDEQIQSMENARIKYALTNEWKEELVCASNQAIIGVPAQISDANLKAAQRDLAKPMVAQMDVEVFLAFVWRLAVMNKPMKLSQEDQAKIRLMLGRKYSWSLEHLLCDAGRAAIVGIRGVLSEAQLVSMDQARRKEAKKENWVRFALMAHDEALVCADEIVIPPAGGLKLVFWHNQPHDKEMPSLPEKRNF